MFSSIIGHDQLKERLSAHLKKDPAGTYLFYGPASIGKRTTAFEASKAVLCHNRIADDCDCPSCKKFKSGHPDFFTVGQDGKIKVADVDRFLEFAETTPLLSDFKAAVLDNAHEITWEAANRLLRVLEEPPAGFVIFLVSSDPQSLLLTVLSRCIRYEFGALSREDLTNIIWKKLGFSPAEASILGWMAAGSSIDIFSKAGLYLKHRGTALEFLSGVRYRPLVDSMDFIDKIEKQDLPIFIDMIMLILTDFLLLKNNVPDIANADLLDVMKKASVDLNGKALIGVAGQFGQLKRNMRLNVNLGLNLKNVLIKTHPLFLA
jgi:DNA polymerase-3 subunit delta'